MGYFRIPNVTVQKTDIPLLVREYGGADLTRMQALTDGSKWKPRAWLGHDQRGTQRLYVGHCPDKPPMVPTPTTQRCYVACPWEPGAELEALALVDEDFQNEMARIMRPVEGFGIAVWWEGNKLYVGNKRGAPLTAGGVKLDEDGLEAKQQPTLVKEAVFAGVRVNGEVPTRVTPKVDIIAALRAHRAAQLKAGKKVKEPVPA